MQPRSSRVRATSEPVHTSRMSKQVVNGAMLKSFRQKMCSSMQFAASSARSPRAGILASVALLLGAALSSNTHAAEDSQEWHSLFNGKDLAGWTVKIAHHPLGDNYANTFRVDDGVIKVSYDGYSKFENRFGHLYTNQPYSRYVLRLEYRITGEGISDAPHWAKLNSGVMIHTQSPLSMRVEQGFPVSMEFQFLAAKATAGTQTANAVTPGTNLVLNGELLTDHIIDSKSKLYPLDEWVTAEVEVRGDEEVIHRINGAEVLRYQHPQLDPTDKDAQQLLASGAPLRLSFGHIALQAEGQPIWFRNIRIRQLE
jgi:Domain of Unknown Function (DUF1080)